jgi:hypothetical protein
MSDGLNPALEGLDRLDGLEKLDRLASTGARELQALSGHRLAAAWWAVTEDLPRLLPADLKQGLTAASGLSTAGLEAGLDLVVDGVRTEACRRLLAETVPPAAPLSPVLVVLASNLPGLALQCLLPALAARRPLLLKTPSAEPDFTPWLLDRLGDAEPALRSSLAAATWRGGDRAVEDLVLPRVSRVVAYGGDGALTDLRRRSATAGTRLWAHGAKISLGLVAAGSDLNIAKTAQGLARDVALFDQRGCLSVHSVLVLRAKGGGEEARLLSEALAVELERLAVLLPPGPAATAQLAAVRAVRDEAAMAGLWTARLPLRQGTVILDHRSLDEGATARLESPGLRTVRVVPVASFEGLKARLEPWRGRIQGIAIAGPVTGRAADFLRRHGVSRIAAAGELQAMDAATWHNGGRAPLETYAAFRDEVSPGARRFA